MDDVIATIAETVGIEPGTAEKAVGIMLALVRSDGDPSAVPKLMDALSGAEALADAHSGGGGGGLQGALSALGGNAMAAFGKLTQTGLTTEQIKAIAELLFEYARERAGEPLVKRVVASIPGLAPYV